MQDRAITPQMNRPTPRRPRISWIDGVGIDGADGFLLH
jgi:hypothetical protein